jgi:hypothetical protein
MAVDPAEGVVAQRRPEALRPYLPVPGYLDRPCLGEAPYRLFVLTSFATIDGDIAAPTPVDAGV